MALPEHPLVRWSQIQLISTGVEGVVNDTYSTLFADLLAPPPCPNPSPGFPSTTYRRTIIYVNEPDSEATANAGWNTKYLGLTSGAKIDFTAAVGCDEHALSTWWRVSDTFWFNSVDWRPSFDRIGLDCFVAGGDVFTIGESVAIGNDVF